MKTEELIRVLALDHSAGSATNETTDELLPPAAAVPESNRTPRPEWSVSLTYLVRLSRTPAAACR
jgi:hypothetical protein